MIADVAGKDCTKAFEDAGHSTDARQLLKQFKIGELIEVICIEKKKKTHSNNRLTIWIELNLIFTILGGQTIQSKQETNERKHGLQ